MIKLITSVCLFMFSLPILASQEYEFSVDWFSPSKPLFEKHLTQLAKSGNAIRYLELGIYEGRSFTWVMDNVMTNPQSRAIGVDLFDSPNIESRFKRNLSKTKFPEKAEISKGTSQEIMRKLDGEQFDFIFVDAGHTSFEAISDLIESFRLAKPGGLIVVDDYFLFHKELPNYLRPQIAVDSFLKNYRTKAEVVDYQGLNVEVEGKLKSKPWGIVIKKLVNPCDKVKVNFSAEGNVYQQCTRLSDESYYLWTVKKVYKEAKQIELSKTEIARIEKFLTSVGEMKPFESSKIPKFISKILAKETSKNKDIP